MTEWIIRLPESVIGTFDARDAGALETLKAQLETEGITIESMQLMNAVWKQVDGGRDAGAAVDRMERDEWPHVRIVSDRDPTGSVLSFVWPSPIDSGPDLRKLIEFVHRMDDGKVTLVETQAALKCLIRHVLGSRVR